MDTAVIYLFMYLFIIYLFIVCVVTQAFNLSTQEAASGVLWVQGQPIPHSEFQND